MDWTTPSCEQIKMDAEIGSYQPDDQRGTDRAVGLHAGPPLRTLTSRDQHLAPDDRFRRLARESVQIPDHASRFDHVRHPLPSGNE
jgi:hypothetical protein